MEQLNLASRYKEIWREFTLNISNFSYDLISSTEYEIGYLHALLETLQPVPYEEAPAFFRGLIGENPMRIRNNIGSVTGLFFEIVAASIIQGYIKKKFPNAAIELNRCSNTDIGSIARDPDIFVHYNNRHLIFETKVSPKKGDLEHLIELHKQYNNRSQDDVRYFLIGGHVTAKEDLILQTQGWACFTSSNSHKNMIPWNQFRLDLLLQEAVSFLSLEE